MDKPRLIYITQCSINTLTSVLWTNAAFLNAFSSVKMSIFWCQFHGNLFLGVQLTTCHHWFRQWLGACSAPSHCLNQGWSQRSIILPQGKNITNDNIIPDMRCGYKLYVVTVCQHHVMFSRNQNNPMFFSHFLFGITTVPALFEIRM